MRFNRKSKATIDDRSESPYGVSGVSGFTLIELIVAISIFGILVAAAAVSWVSFTREQNVRQEANSLHKEIIALKATALSNAAEVEIKYTNGASLYTVEINREKSDGTPDKYTKRVNMHKEVKISNGGSNCDGDVSTNNWQVGGKIVIEAKNIDAYEDGCVVIEHVNGKTKRYRVIKYEDDIKPKLEVNSGSGWNDM